MSGIYIPGMEKPSDCENCIFCYDDECLMHKPNEYRSWPEEYKNCPLVPVPEHGRLGDLDALKVSLAFAKETAEWAVPALRAVLRVIDEMPTIIPADKEAT